MRCSDREHVLLVTMHHIVADGWSMGVLIDELSALYKAFRGRAIRCRGWRSSTPTTRCGSGDGWRGERCRSSLSYWTKKLSGAPTLLEVPTDRPRPAVQDYAGASRSDAGRRADAGPQGAEPAARDHALHDVVVRVGGGAVAAERAGGGGDRHAGGEPASDGGRAAHRLLRQHAGAAGGSSRARRRWRSCSER